MGAFAVGSPSRRIVAPFQGSTMAAGRDLPHDLTQFTIVRAHHAALIAVEGIVNGHYLAWKRGGTTPLQPALDAMSPARYRTPTI